MFRIITVIAISILFSATAMAAEKNLSGDITGMKMADNPVKNDTAYASGIVENVNITAGKVTLQHGPIAAINWPAMTMEFNVVDPALLKGINEGEVVDFTLKAENNNQVVIAIEAKK
ncbi:copper-binding protein [Ewingella sp. S1.OA.A_B6]